jgi:chloride channel, nucleotide-sensitive, 1A
MDADDDAFVDADPNNLELISAEGDGELSEVGRVRSDFINDNRYNPY